MSVKSGKDTASKKDFKSNKSYKRNGTDFTDEGVFDASETASRRDSEIGIIDVRPIYNGEVKEIEFSFDLPSEDYGFEDVVFDSPINVSGKVTRRATGRGGSEDFTELSLCVCADITAKCARCLCEIPDTLEYTQSYSLTKSANSEDGEEYICVKHGRLDLYETARSLFLLNLPMRFLCDEDCKGICFTCGKNLNEGDCDCESDAEEKKVDPRLAALLDIEID